MELQPESEILAVRFAVLRPDTNETLLVQRSFSANYNPGLWEFPGGKSEPGEDPTTAGLREVTEETGIVAEVLEEPFEIERRPISDGKHAGKTHRTLGGIALHRAGSLLKHHNRAEVADAVWVPLGGLRQFQLTRVSRSLAAYLLAN